MAPRPASDPSERRLLKVVEEMDIASGTHPQRPDVTMTRSRRIVVGGSDAIDYQIDGDAFSTTAPLEIGLADEKLQILVPRYLRHRDA